MTPRAAEADGEPTERVSAAWTRRFALVWFGYWMANLVPVQLVLPNQFDAFDHAHKVRDFGVVSGISGLAALVTLPLFGALCDRTRSRFGRRRSWVVGGLLVFAAGLLATGLQSGWVAVGLAWLVATLGLNMATAGLTAVIADDVPDEQRGAISAAVYGPQAVGLLVGLVVVSLLDNNGVWAYLFLALAVLACAVPFVAGYRDEPSGPRPALSLRSVRAGLWISPRRNPDFAWAFGGRLLVNLGNALGTTYLFYFLQDDLELHDPDAGLLVLTLIYLVFTLTATVWGGQLSDRLGRRRIFVALASGSQAVACVLLTAFPSFASATVGAAFLGAGYGTYMSVDQALITAVLPDATSRAKDLGIMNVGSVGPQALAPLAASLIIDSLGGYGVLFGTAGVVTVAGSVLVYRVRGVR